MVVTVLLGLVLLLIASAAVLYGTHRGYKRSMDFWYHVGPLIAEWKLLKARRKYLFHSRKDDDEWYELMTSYHQKTAPKVVNVIMKLGGIYVKIGQFLAAVGGGVMDDSYVTALQPLQEGMPPQPISEISGIIESSLGRPLDDLFSEFDETPIGAASIAQAHGAVWRKDGSSVIVKVQYPFVADLYEADFHNLELATKFINPDNVPTIDTLKERHRKELDFNLEAHNLAEVSANMQRHGLEPRVIRIPRVIETSKNVLVMEYLKGKSLAEAMEEEHDQIAKSLGMANSTELRKTVIKNLRDHFKGGGGGHDLVTGAATQAAPLVRMYAGIAKTIRNFGRRVHNVVDKTIEIVSGGNHEAHLLQLEETIGVNLKQVLKTLVHVHGIQVMLDGVYNADPHQGNVIIMPSGQIGLIDYGMVGRLSVEQRTLIASTILALHRGDRETVVHNYRDSGYVIGWRKSDYNHTDNVIYRCASFHLDRVNLSPIHVQGKKWNVLELLAKSKERCAPDWIEQMKRLGGLMIGVSAQAGRPISLSKEWSGTAKQYMREHDGLISPNDYDLWE